jgi:hypothetical protein
VRHRGVVRSKGATTDGPEQGALRATDRCAHPRRRDRRGRCLPRPVHGGRAQAGDGREDGGAPARSSRWPTRTSGNPAGGSEEVRPDCIIATGRSDYPNQVNNVLCFPFIFRGALDVGATKITDEMKLACVKAIAELARPSRATSSLRPTAEGDRASGRSTSFRSPSIRGSSSGSHRRLPEAAMASGVATRPIEDFAAYVASLTDFVYQSGHRHEAGVQCRKGGTDGVQARDLRRRRG